MEVKLLKLDFLRDEESQKQHSIQKTGKSDYSVTHPSKREA